MVPVLQYGIGSACRWAGAYREDDCVIDGDSLRSRHAVGEAVSSKLLQTAAC